MDIDNILTEFEKQKKIGQKKIKKGSLSVQELDKNLFNGACLEFLKLWLSQGIGAKKTKLRHASKTTNRKQQYIKAMLNRLEKHWHEFCTRVNRQDRNDHFKKFLCGYHKNLYEIWTS